MRDYKRLCKDIENVENYEKAAADNFKNWVLHHRLQTWTSDGERRLVDISAAELKALDMYYNRPANELIFMSASEHTSLHSKGKPKSEATRNKLSTANKGKPGPNKGKVTSEETKKKQSEAKKEKYIGENNPFYGKHHTEGAKNRISEAHKGEKNHNYGKRLSEETKKKISNAKKGNTNVKGYHWYNNGEINIRAKECSEGFVPGRLKRK